LCSLIATHHIYYPQFIFPTLRYCLLSVARYIFASSLLSHFSALHFHSIIIPRRSLATIFYGRELNLMLLKVFPHCHGPSCFLHIWDLSEFPIYDIFFSVRTRYKTLRAVQIQCPGKSLFSKVSNTIGIRIRTWEEVRYCNEPANLLPDPCALDSLILFSK